ncbi:MAG: RecX family transcriptional regulator [Anaerolineales bacterium]|nr:RecX family transcriptional regulator [Anaerolineales bacterium]
MQGKVTALKVQKRNKQRVNVYLDGEFAFGLSRYAAGWLHVGQELGPEKIVELQAIDAQEVAFQRALNYLSYRDRSTQEIRDHLGKHGVEEEVIAEVLARLARDRLVDDRQFAALWVENRSEFRPRGRRALAQELRQKGIGVQVIDETLSDLDEEQLAYQAACLQVRKYRELEWPEFRRKLSAFLARRGFSYGTVATAVRQVWQELDQA